MASVAEIDGLTVPSAFLLDTYTGAAAAYSVRQLKSGATVAMRVRRVTGAGNTGNDDEADVVFDTSLATPTISLDSPVRNFSAGGSNATTLGEFLNVGTVPPYNGGLAFSNADSLTNTASCFVDEWKDQSGNANHATQSTPASQPQIHSGTVDTDLITEGATTSRPALQFDNSSTRHLQITSPAFRMDIRTCFYVFRETTSVNFSGIVSCADISGEDFNRTAASNINTGNGTTTFGYIAVDLSSSAGGANKNVRIQGTKPTPHSLASFKSDSTNASLQRNNGTFDTATHGYGTNVTNPGNAYVGCRYSAGPSNGLTGTIQEVIIYDTSTHQSNMSSINNDLNSYFGIY